MNFVRIASILGAIVLTFGLCMLVPLGVSVVTRDGASHAFALPMLFTLTTGGLLYLIGQRFGGSQKDLRARDGVLLAGLAWTLLPLFASLPLLAFFSGTRDPLSFSGAYFEAMSGLTTTGATVLVGLDHLPNSINF